MTPNSKICCKKLEWGVLKDKEEEDKTFFQWLCANLVTEELKMCGLVNFRSPKGQKENVLVKEF